MRISDWSADVCSSDLHAIAACGKGYAKPGWIWLAVAPHARSRRGRRPFGVELPVHIRSIVEPGARFKRLLLPGWTGCAEHPASGQACSIPIAKPPRREGLRRPNFTDGPMKIGSAWGRERVCQYV